jgi:hypothetical protein
MSVFIESSKTDRYRDGAWVLIAKTGTKLCPVANVQKLNLWGEFLDSVIYVQKTSWIQKKENK